jgi:gas vesicle protein
MNIKKFLKVALGTGLFILDQSDRARKTARVQVGNHVDDLRDLAQDTYQETVDRVKRASKALRKDDDNRTVWDVLRFAVGMGVGIGVGLLIAPANGKETRTKLADKAEEIGDNIRQHLASSNLPATGTGD